MPNRPEKYWLTLSDWERKRSLHIMSNGTPKISVRKVRILYSLDHLEIDGERTLSDVSHDLIISVREILAIRKKYIEEGFDACINPNVNEC